MNELFSLKYKMHKLVNIIFYLILIVIGYIGGAYFEKIYNFFINFFS